MDKQKDTASANEVAICDCIFCKLERQLRGQPEPTTEQVQANMLESIRRLMEVHNVSFEELRVLVVEFAKSRDKRRAEAVEGIIGRIQNPPVEPDFSAWPRGGYNPTGRKSDNPLNFDYSKLERSAEQQEFDRKSRLALDNFMRMSPEERAELARKFTEELKRNAGF